MRARERVVITGLGCVTPLGNNVASTWAGLAAGRNAIGRIERFDPTGFVTDFAAEVKGFDPRGSIEPKEAKRWDRFCQFGVVAAKQAVAEAQAAAEASANAA